MLPPIDDAVFKNNPSFENLYKSLTGTILHPDGSTKNDAAAKKRDAVREELKSHRLRETRRYLLKNALSTTPSPSSTSQPARSHRRIKSQLSQPARKDTTSQLPPELLDLLLLLPSFLDRAETTRASDLELLLSNPPFSNLVSLLPQLTPLISSHLTTQASNLTRVLHPSTNPSFLHRSIPKLLPSVENLLSTLSSNRSTVSSRRLAATSNLVAYLNLHTEALVLLVRALEAKHGPAAYSTELRASEAKLEAQLWAASLQLFLWETQSRVYPPESQVALKNYRRHLRDAQMQLANKMRTREQELSDYGVSIGGEDGGVGVGRGNEAKERTMREMSRVWKEMEGRLADIQRDLERLDRS